MAFEKHQRPHILLASPQKCNFVGASPSALLFSTTQKGSQDKQAHCQHQSINLASHQLRRNGERHRLWYAGSRAWRAPLRTGISGKGHAWLTFAFRTIFVRSKGKFESEQRNGFLSRRADSHLSAHLSISCKATLAEKEAGPRGTPRWSSNTITSRKRTWTI